MHYTPHSPLLHHSTKSPSQRILRVRGAPAVLRYAGLEPVFEFSGHFLEVAHAACAGGLSSLGFHSPVVWF